MHMLQLTGRSHDHYCLDNWRPWLCPRSLFSKIFIELLFRWTLWMYRPNLKSTALPVA